MKEKIYNLLMVTYRGLLESCYRQVFFSDSELSAVKTFDDYLTDFYIYLYEAKPKYVEQDIKGYYLTQIRDEKATPAWLQKTFRNFLLEENKILVEMRDALAEYRKQLTSYNKAESIDITLMHIGFSIAWFNQHESCEDRYLFFRNAYKHFMGFYTWPDSELDDKDVANILKISHGTLRTRTSRLCQKVKRLVMELNDALIATLNKQSLDIAKEIYAVSNPDMQYILEDLLGQCERELPQYEQIIKLRQEKRKSINILANLQQKLFTSKSTTSCEAISMEDKILYDIPEDSSVEVHMPDEQVYNKRVQDSQTRRIINLFKSIIGL